MKTTFEPIDYVVFGIYAAIVLFMGLFVSRTKKGIEKTAQDYFLANRSLTWWAIGASLIAANISAEHFIAMSGSGFRIGLGIAAYEWVAAITLIFVGKYFVPVFLEKKIYTMPQFLEQRYNRGVSLAFAIFWLLVYVFVNLTTVIWLGAKAMHAVMGVNIMYSVFGLALFAAIYSIYGGLKAVAWTDVIQVVFLVGGGLVTCYFALDAVGGGRGFVKGFAVILDHAPEHFKMIVREGTVVPDGQGGVKDAYADLPGLAVLLGGMWLTNIGYWGFNQYIIQKGLAAKSLTEAKRGLLFAGYLKILIPLIVLIPGITAYVLYNNPELASGFTLQGEIKKADDAYPWLLANFVPSGLRGIAFAALVAAVVSSLASMINSTSTIFTMDIYKPHIRKQAAEREMVFVGRLVALIALIIAVFMARPLLGGLDQAFQYIQEYTGYIYPGVVVVFFMGLFWKQATARAALVTTILTLPAGFVIKMLIPDMPFILRMGYVMIFLVLVASVVSVFDRKAWIPVANSASRARGAVSIGWGLVVAGLLALVSGALFFGKYRQLGVESVFVWHMSPVFGHDTHSQYKAAIG